MRRALAALLAALALSGCLKSLDASELTDPAIKARIEASLRGRTDLDLRYVTVEVSNRVVILSGVVPSREQSRTIGRLAASAPGVEQTLNNLLVQE